MKFVSKDLATKLKEKGFDKPCFGWYYIKTPTARNDGELILNTSKTRGVAYEDLLYSHNDNFIDYEDNYVDAPTIEQVLEWLREEKNIFIWMKPYHTYATKNNICWDWNIVVVVNNNHKLSKYCSDEGFVEYEDACIAGIEYVINNLI